MKGKSNDGNYKWLFICECGNKKEIPLSRVKKGDTKSCGCLISETSKKTILKLHVSNKLPIGESSFNALFQSYKKAAKRRDLIFELSEKEFRDLTQKNCYYCGSEPYSKYRASIDKNNYFLYNGVDRVKNNIGYVLENCVPCCKFCNSAKLKETKEDFLDWVKKIYKYQFGDEK